MRAQTYRWDQTAAPPNPSTWAPTTGDTITTREQVGDVTSKKRGSGARYNTDKPRADLLDLSAISALAGRAAVSDDVVLAMHCLEEFRAGGGKNYEELECALAVLCEDDPSGSLFSAAAVQAYGAAKYAPGNWCKGMKWSVVFGCAARHAIKALVARAEDVDEDSGQPHRAHLICNIMYLLHYTRNYPEGNDFVEAYGALAGDIE